MSHLERIWLCEVGGACQKDGEVDVEDLSGHMAEGEVADHFVVGHGNVHLGQTLPG